MKLQTIHCSEFDLIHYEFTMTLFTFAAFRTSNSTSDAAASYFQLQRCAWRKNASLYYTVVKIDDIGLHVRRQPHVFANTGSPIVFYSKQVCECF